MKHTAHLRHEAWWWAEKKADLLWDRASKDGVTCWLDWLPSLCARHRYAAQRALHPENFTASWPANPTTLRRLLRRRRPRTDDTVPALLSPAYVLCPHCGARRQGDPTIAALAWAARHCPDDPHRHRLAPDGDPTYTYTWLHRRGYRIAPESAPPHLDLTWIPIRRGHEPTITARLGDTLVWHGDHLTVEPPTDHGPPT